MTGTERRRSPLLPIFLVVLVDVMGLTIILPLLPFYAETFGASAQTVGLLVTTYAACQLVSGPLLGRISDRVGRRPLLLVSQAGTLAGFFVLAFSKTLWMVFLARVIDGATAGNLSLAQAYISDVTEAKDRAKSFGVIGVAFGVGFLVGPGVSGYLSQWSYQLPIFVAAGLSATSILATWFLLPREPPPHAVAAKAAAQAAVDAGGPPPPAGRRLSLLDWGTYVDYFRRPQLAIVLLQFFCFTLFFALFNGGFALFAERRYTWHGHPFGPKQVGYVFAFVGFLGIILQGGLIGRLVKRFGEARLAVAGFISVAVAYGLLGFTSTVPELLAVAVVASFGNGVLRPVLTSVITQRVSRGEQGTVLGLNQSLQSVAQIIGPALAGLLINKGLLAAWSLTAAAVAVVGLVLAVQRGSFASTGDAAASS